MIFDRPHEQQGSVRVSGSCSSLAVIPAAYNEAATIAEVIGALYEQAPDFDVLVVDDGSTDDTAAQARNSGARVLSLPFNLGIGGAVQAGFLHALEHEYAFMAQVDGDGQHGAGELSRLVQAMNAGDVDMVCGSRFLTSDFHYPRARQPADRYPHLRLRALADRRNTRQ